MALSGKVLGNPIPGVSDGFPPGNTRNNHFSSFDLGIPFFDETVERLFRRVILNGRYGVHDTLSISADLSYAPFFVAVFQKFFPRGHRGNSGKDYRKAFTLCGVTLPRRGSL